MAHPLSMDLRVRAMARLSAGRFSPLGPFGIGVAHFAALTAGRAYRMKGRKHVCRFIFIARYCHRATFEAV
jgi:hypothetical protein